MKPQFRIEIAGSDLTQAFRERLVSIEAVDNVGYDSDTVAVTLSDKKHELEQPRTGAELSLWLGFGDSPEKVGVYTVNETVLHGTPSRLTIKAHAANMKAGLKESKSRSFDDITLESLVTAIASEHDLTPIVGADLKGVHYEHLDQTEESDLHFLTRLASDLDAVSKPTHNRLVFARRGDQKSASGIALPVVSLKLSDITTWRAPSKDRFLFRKVVAQYQDIDAAELVKVSVGEGTPVQIIRRTYADRTQAQRAAQARYDRHARGKSTITLTMPGRTDIAAETPLELSECQDGVNGRWVTTTARHSLRKETGLVTAITAERKD